MEHSAKRRDLEERTFRFAESVRAFVKQLPKTISNLEDIRQLVRASGSVAANWIEADEALSKKDLLMRVKICRKEAKESRLFLRLVDAGLTGATVSARDKLGEEARELTLIFLRSSQKSNNWLSLDFPIFKIYLGIGNWGSELRECAHAYAVNRLAPLVGRGLN
jgi:four helix bundle protein